MNGVPRQVERKIKLKDNIVNLDSYQFGKYDSIQQFKDYIYSNENAGILKPSFIGYYFVGGVIDQTETFTLCFLLQNKMVSTTEGVTRLQLSYDINVFADCLNVKQEQYIKG